MKMTIPVTSHQLSTALADVMGMAASVNTTTIVIRDDSIVGGVPRRRLVNYMERLKRAIDVIDKYSSTPGLLQYARDQYNDQTLDIVADFGTFRSSCNQLKTWVFNTFPKDAGTGAWLVSEFDANGVETQLTFTSAQLSTFVTHCNTLLATMD